jgi:hypothetical protein
MKKYMVSKEEAWKLDTSMFIIEGSWETGYLLNDELLQLTGVIACEVGETTSVPYPGFCSLVTGETQDLAQSRSIRLRMVASHLRFAAMQIQMGKDSSESLGEALRCLSLHYSNYIE